MCQGFTISKLQIECPYLCLFLSLPNYVSYCTLFQDFQAAYQTSLQK